MNDQIETSNYPWYDLKRKYAAYNKQYFGGTLPRKLPVVWFRTNGTIAGQTTFRRMPDGREIPLRIAISDEYELVERQLDETLLHEMLHVALAVDGKPNADGCPIFVQAATIISIQFGHDISGPLLVDPSEEARRMVVISIGAKADRRVVVLTPAEFDAAEEELIPKLKKVVQLRRETFMVIRAHTTLHKKYPPNPEVTYEIEEADFWRMIETAEGIPHYFSGHDYDETQRP